MLCARPAAIRSAGSAVLPLDLPEVRSLAPRAHVPAETRGEIGGRATAYGVGTKQDGSLDDVVDGTSEPDDQLIDMPSADASWAIDAIETIGEASERAAAIGEIALANLWRRNLGRPRSRYSDPGGLLRMLARMERSHAARTRQLSAVEPAVLYRDIAEVPLAGALYPTSLLPAAVAAAIVCAINARIRAIARGGFAQWQAVNAGNAPPELVAERSAISSITGAAVRVINQIGHLEHISRRGQRAHRPMTLGRRRALVAAALAQLAADVAAGPWTPESLGLMTPALCAAWRQRACAEPLPAPRYRDLFAWGGRNCPAPAELDDGELARLIQQHPDLAYVERLRRERAERAKAEAVAR